MEITLRPACINGTIDIPGSKSHTIRALLIALFAQGRSTLRNALDSQDTKACIRLCESLGACATWSRQNPSEPPALIVDSGDVSIEEGVPKRCPTIVDCGNSGTTLYLASAMCTAALGGRVFEFRGDGQLSKRPVTPLLDSLSA